MSEKNIYNQMNKNEITQEHQKLWLQYNEYKAKNLQLNMTRGVPCKGQLDLSNDLITLYPGNINAKDIGDVRNYGGLAGAAEARELFRELFEADSINEVLVFGNSSLNIMYDIIIKAMMFGMYEGCTPWGKLEKVKFLCPVPGYDRHFTICESLGIEMINVSMTDTGPDMDEIERLVANDKSIKGIWCVPKYSNPDGITYSDETVRKFAELSPAASDFRIFWDNAYIVHDLAESGDTLLNIYNELKKNNKEDMIYMFASMSKITFPGSGIAAVCSSEKNIKFMISKIFAQTIGPDKLNQLKHVQFLKNKDGITAHMAKHRAIIAPKFSIVTECFEKNLGDTGLARWSIPNGGYFISLFVPENCARRTIELASDIGVALTSAGSTYPYKKDPSDSNIRIAPTMPPMQDLILAAEAICICTKLAYMEKLIRE